jgi:hypothetical protein
MVLELNLNPKPRLRVWSSMSMVFELNPKRSTTASLWLEGLAMVQVSGARQTQAPVQLTPKA